MLKPSHDKFTAEQAASTVELMRRIASRDGDAHELKDQLIDEAERLLAKPHEDKGKWS